MDTRSYGWLLRVYVKDPADVEGRIARVARIVSRIREVSDGPIALLIPKEKDCGATPAAALEQLRESVGVLSTDGSPCTDTLNSGFKALHHHGCTHAVVISNKAVESLSSDVLAEADAAFEAGAKVVGVAVTELAWLVRKGIPQNTFAIWDLDSSVAAGSFRYEHPQKGGIEEISLLLALVNEYGPCMQVVTPEDVSLAIHTTEEGTSRYAELMKTKLERVNDLFHAAGRQLDTWDPFLPEV